MAVRGGAAKCIAGTDSGFMVVQHTAVLCAALALTWAWVRGGTVRGETPGSDSAGGHAEPRAASPLLPPRRVLGLLRP
eukprot:3298856-Rhodomonas_salina.1